VRSAKAVSGYAILIAVIAAIGGLLFGYDTSVISGAILFVRKQFALNALQTELAVSVVLAGAALGAAFAGYLSDQFGRRPVLVVNAIIFGVFAVVTGSANGMGLFLVARFLVGIAIGVTSMITPLYIAELAPASIRGALVTLNQLAIVTGIVVAYYVDYLFAGSKDWRAMFISAVIPSILLLIALIFLPESPRWLAARGRFESAERVLVRVESSEEVRRDLEELHRVTEVDRLTFRDLLAPRFRKPLWVGVGLAVFQQITGVNTIIYYTPTILQMGGYRSASTAIFATVLVGGVNLVATIVSLFLLDRVGRRPLLLVGIAGMTFGLADLGFSFGARHVSPAAVLLDVVVYLASFAVSLGPIFWLLISEIYPTTIRGQAMSLATVVIWIADLVVSITFLSLVQAVGARLSFWLYGAACIAAFVFSLKLVPETKDKTLEQIEASW
jgi:MFS transporter, SP family, galactose:H+ symporter